MIFEPRAALALPGFSFVWPGRFECRRAQLRSDVYRTAIYLTA